MSKTPDTQARRRFLKLAAVGAVAAPIASTLLPRFARADDLPQLRAWARAEGRPVLDDLRQRADKFIQAGPTPEPTVRGTIRDPETRSHWWPNREQTLKSYELFARHVMPRFQGSADAPRASNEWARGNRRTIFSPNVEAIRRAYTDAGREIPAEYRQRTSGARDLDPPATTTTP